MVVFTREELLELSQVALMKATLLDPGHPKFELWKAIDRKLDSLCAIEANKFITEKQQNHENTSNT